MLYPPREMCDGCLDTRLHWTHQDGRGELISETRLDHSHDLFFKERLPWRLGLVKLDAGPSIVAHVHGDIPPAPARVRLEARLDRAGRGVLFAMPSEDTPHMMDDRQLREMTCDPKYRRVLVTDGKSEVGQAVVRALLDAGAALVWIGTAEAWKQPPGYADLVTLERTAVIPLDVTDQRSVSEAAAAIGGRVDILINTAELHRTQGIASRSGTETARSEMEVNYFGLLRLAQAFGPAMKGRGADGDNSAVAWVNLLSIFALASFPAHGTFSASKAAAFSLSQTLRAEFMPAAIRVINVFPGPVDDQWNQAVPPPKVAPERLARDIIDALRRGIEDVYPGDVAQEWVERYLEDPKVLERELAE